MTREIKFRAWDHETNTMLHHEHFIGDVGAFIELPTWLDLMQYTGLSDKNGVEIYEGDIVRVDDCHYQGEVKWNDQDLSFVIENREGGFGFVNGQIFDERPEYRAYEVIGNIYENPELIKTESE